MLYFDVGPGRVDDNEIAINCKSTMSPAATDFIAQSLSDNSRRAYLSDTRLLVAWGGKLPWTPEKVCDYLAAHATAHRSATLTRRIASIAKAHRVAGLPDPTKSALVYATLRGIRRVHGVAQRQAEPLVREDLVAVCARLGPSLKDIRDRALLLVGFAGAFRRSELVGLDVSDIVEVRQGILVTITRSKTDQFGNGRSVAIPFGRTQLCPVLALKQWLDRGHVKEGPLFRPLSTATQVASERLSAEAVSLIVKQRCAAVGFDPSLYSGHSLRAGLATSAAQAGVSGWKIRAQTGHASDAMLSRYIRDSELWIGNAAAAVL